MLAKKKSMATKPLYKMIVMNVETQNKAATVVRAFDLASEYPAISIAFSRVNESPRKRDTSPITPIRGCTTTARSGAKSPRC